MTVSQYSNDYLDVKTFTNAVKPYRHKMPLVNDSFQINMKLAKI